MKAFKRISLVVGLLGLGVATSTGCKLPSFLSKSEQVVPDATEVAFDDNTYPAVILGSGVGGMTASVYLAMANITTLLVQGRTPGGLLTQSLSVRNWPGTIDAPGSVITDKIAAQAKKRGVIVATEEATSVDTSVWPYRVKLVDIYDKESTREVKALSLIIGMGAASNYLGIEGEKEYWSRGVTNCAVCEGSLYRDKTVCVIGGGDSAIEEASYLAGLAKKVFIFVRRDQLRAVDNRKDEVAALPNVEFVFNTSLKKIVGDKKKVTEVVTVNNKDKTERTYKMNGVFLAIGFTPRTQMFEGQIDLKEGGYVKLVHDQQTSKSGVYAVGDIVDPLYKQAVTAAGDGCRAALQAHNFLQDIGYQPQGVGAQGKEVGQAIVSEEVKPEEVAEGPVKQALSSEPAQAPDAAAADKDIAGEAVTINVEKVEERAEQVKEELQTKEADGQAETVVERGSTEAKEVERVRSDDTKRVDEAYADAVVHDIKTAEEYETLVNTSTVPVVVDFYATWCGPCKLIAPLVKKLATQYGEKVVFAKVNIDDLGMIGLQNNIQGVPTFVFLSDGSEMARLVGGHYTKSDFEKHLKPLLASE